MEAGILDQFQALTVGFLTVFDSSEWRKVHFFQDSVSLVKKSQIVKGGKLIYKRRQKIACVTQRGPGKARCVSANVLRDIAGFEDIELLPMILS